MPELPPSDHSHECSEKPSKSNKPDKSKKRYNWGAIGAISGIVGTVGTLAALYPSYIPVVGNAFSHNEHVYDGPIAQIAIHEKGWDARGFTTDGLTTTADQVKYHFAGHYKDAQTDDANPNNDVCELTLHANPATSYPYGGQSGFVYLQSGTTYHPESKIEYNPTPDEIYKIKLDFHEFVPAKCWPGNMTFPADN